MLDRFQREDHPIHSVFQDPGRLLLTRQIALPDQTQIEPYPQYASCDPWRQTFPPALMVALGTTPPELLGCVRPTAWILRRIQTYNPHSILEGLSVGKKSVAIEATCTGGAKGRPHKKGEKGASFLTQGQE